MAKPSLTLKRTLKFRSQRWRRRQVIWVSLLLGFIWLVNLGAKHHSFHQGVMFFNILVMSLVLTTGWKRRQFLVTNLDDRAIYQFSRSWDKLNEAERELLLNDYRVGSYMFTPASDEPREILRLQTMERSWKILQMTLFVVLIVYLTAWILLPDRPDVSLNPRLLLDPVAWFVGLLSFCIVLPGAVWMWTEPDWESEVLPELQPVASS